MTATKPCFCLYAAPVFLLAALLTGMPAAAAAQTTEVAPLPDAPSQTVAAAQQTAPPPAPASSSSQSQQTSSSSTTPPAQTKQQQQQKSEEELKKEEKQRILGVVPNFNTTNDQNAPPLTPKQKFDLNFHSSVDPFVFVFAGIDAAEEQAEDTFPEYGQGAEGYAKRFGASYADTFDGNLWGNAILPVLLHEDPRYFRKGTGSFMSRFLYSAATTVWSRRDNTTWGPNYANVGGNFIAGGISNLYYPQSDRGFSLTVTRALTVTAEGAIGSEFVEFWPDISQHLFHKKDQSLTAPTAHQPGQPQTPPETDKPVQPAPKPPQPPATQQ